MTLAAFDRLFWCSVCRRTAALMVIRADCMRNTRTWVPRRPPYDSECAYDSHGTVIYRSPWWRRNRWMTHDKLIAQNYTLPTVLGSSSFYILLFVLPHYSDIIPCFLLSRRGQYDRRSQPRITSNCLCRWSSLLSLLCSSESEAPPGELRAVSRHPLHQLPLPFGV